MHVEINHHIVVLCCLSPGFGPCGARSLGVGEFDIGLFIRPDSVRRRARGVFPDRRDLPTHGVSEHVEHPKPSPWRIEGLLPQKF